jgi:hypothetical protein
MPRLGEESIDRPQVHIHVLATYLRGGSRMSRAWYRLMGLWPLGFSRHEASQYPCRRSSSATATTTGLSVQDAVTNWCPTGFTITRHRTRRRPAQTARLAERVIIFDPLAPDRVRSPYTTVPRGIYNGIAVILHDQH